MQILTSKPELRFQFRHNGKLTVLEGAELGLLIKRFFQQIRRVAKKEKEFMPAFVAAILGSYWQTYGADVVSEDDLKMLVSADARKLDLFYRGMLLVFYEAQSPVEKRAVERLLGSEKSMWEVADELIEIKPGLFGVSLDVNKLVKMVRRT